MYNRDRLDKAYENVDFSELVNAPVDALQGVTQRDARYLLKAFNVKTIGELAELKYARWAREICELADSGAGDMTIPSSFKDKLDKKYETKTALAIAKAPVHALQGVSKGDALLLQKAFKIKTVRQLAELKYYAWACDIVEQSRRRMEKVPVRAEGAASSKKSRWLMLLLVLIAVAFGVYYLLPKMQSWDRSRSADVPAPTAKLEPAPQPETPPVSTSPGPALTPGQDKAPAATIIEESKKDVKPQDNVYVVQPKDDLISISEKVYGNYQGWIKIYDANKDKVKSPILIFPGQQLVIPGWKRP